ncbi:unnamed protein product [Pieris macdunnoughi]|uniref:Uncharacterized protein n=2 Tax=Pieris macdunnoughi TaxID=345717 RepID=A0A821MJ05_9NEOP|nr:unnamed protein product [Pieris macdunnoughi]
MQYPLVTITARAHPYIMIYLWFIFIICAADAAKSIKGLYCQDPDTHKLYPVNATWPSETFCGNYTCKLRKKNHTETEYVPITKINITDKYFLRDIDDMKTSPSDNSFAVTKESQQDKSPVYIENSFSPNQQKLNNQKDRYLTDTEIKAITEILHTVKKSDLEAIIEIYNLAQEFHKEIDGATTESLIKETINALQDEKHEKKKNHHKSYFYKPLHQTHMEKNLTDMEKESSRVPPQTYYPYPYFNGPTLRNGFGRTPYYYPMSNFQRSASYIHRPYLPPTPPTARPCTTPPRPCSKPCTKPHGYLPPWYNKSVIKPYVNKHHLADPMLLPYPFSYIHHYNYSSYPASYYYNNYPWAQLDSYRKAPSHAYQPQLAPEDTKAAIAEEKTLEAMKNDGSSEVESDNEWKTKPLSEKILDEVRANLDKSKLLKPLRKKVKLERVGKVIKLDELTREKRSVIEIKGTPDAYEAYIDTSKCEPSITPGFFRVGNLSAPFPECCPQRIS